MKTHAFPRVFPTVLLLLLFLTLASCAAEVGDRLPTDPATEDAGTETEAFPSEVPSETVAPEASGEAPAVSSEAPAVSSEAPEASSEAPEASSESPMEESTEESPVTAPLSPTEGLAYQRYHDGYGYIDEYVLVGMGSSTAEHLVIPSTHKGWRVREIEAGAFKGNTELLSVTFLEGTKQIPEDLFTGCTALTRVCIMEGTKSIGNGAFAGCTALSEIVLPDDLNSIGDGSFAGCTSLSEILLPATLVRIGVGAFKDCTTLGEITVPNGTPSLDADVFSGCTALSEITLPEGLRYIGDGTFAGCTSLSEILLPATLVRIGKGAFKNCITLGEITIPNGTSSLGTDAFSGCSSLARLTLPAGIYQTLGSNFFSDCTSLREVIFSEGTRVIPDGVLKGCTSLTRVVLPEGLVRIDDSAFQNCTGLTEITIPASVRSIGRWAFSGCTALSRMTFYGVPETVEADALAECDPEIEIVCEEPPTRETFLHLSRVLPHDVRVRAEDGSRSYAPPFYAYRWNSDLNCAVNYSVKSRSTLPVLRHAVHDTSAAESEIAPATLRINGAEFSIPYKTTFWGDSYGGVPFRYYTDGESGLQLELFREDGAIRLFNAYGYYAAAGDPAYRSVAEDADALAIATEFIEAQVLRQIPDVTLADYRTSVTHHTGMTAGEEYVGYDYVSFRFVWCMDGVPTKDEIRISVSAGGNIVYFYRGNDCSFAAGDTVGLAEAYEYAWEQARYEARNYYQGTVGYVRLVSIDRVQNRLAYRFRVGLVHGAPNADVYSECQTHYYTELILLRNPDVEDFLPETDPDGTLVFGGTEGSEAVYAVPDGERETLTDASPATVTEENIPDREFVLNGRTLNAIYVETRTNDPTGRAGRVRIHRDAETGITLGFDAGSGALVLLDARDYYDGAGDVPREGVGTPTATVSAFLAMHTAGTSLSFPEYRHLRFSVDAEDSEYSYGYARYVYTRHFGAWETPDRLVLYLSDGKNVVYFERGADYADVKAPDVDVAEADRAVVRWACRYASYLDHGALQCITFSGLAENALGVGLLYRVSYECRSADGESTVSFTETYFYLLDPVASE